MASSDDIIPGGTTEGGTTTVVDDSSYYDTLMQVSNEILTNPLNLILLSISAFLLYKILSGRQAPRGPQPEPEVEMPRMKKKDMFLDELKQYNGTNEDGRICIAVNGRVYDVTLGKQFYGSGGPYSIFAGRDASRALALFTVSESALKTEDDDLSDLTSGEMNRMREWQIQLEEKYDFVGRLLKPGQEPVDYTDSEDDLNPDEPDNNPDKEEEGTPSSSSPQETTQEEVKEGEPDSTTKMTSDINTKKEDDVEEETKKKVQEEEEMEPEKEGEKEEPKEEVKQKEEIEKVEEEEISTKKTEL